MIDDFAKYYLHHELRKVREVQVWKLDGLSEYDIRRPLTATGTNLLGLVKHRAYSDASGEGATPFGAEFGYTTSEPGFAGWVKHWAAGKPWFDAA